MSEMIKLNIDGKDVEIEKGKTVLEAARKVNIEIPTLCFLKEINEQKQDISYRTVYEKTAFNTINEFFYKNEELYQKKIFLSADSYEVFVYFSKDYWVVSLYEKDLKKSDAYYLNGNLTRKKDFEVSP